MEAVEREKASGEKRTELDEQHFLFEKHCAIKEEDRV